MRFEATMSLEAAKDRYFTQNGFDPASPESFIAVKLGGVTVPFPNSEDRRKVLPLHDLHHIATEFDTDFAGETEIGAFELAAGCGRSFTAWFYNLGSFSIGVSCWPRRVLKAWARGRRSRSLLVSPELKDAATVAELRARLGLPAEADFALSDLPSFLGALALLPIYAVAWLPLYLALSARALAERSRTERLC
jgi:hypothetical protein